MNCYNGEEGELTIYPPAPIEFRTDSGSADWFQ